MLDERSVVNIIDKPTRRKLPARTEPIAALLVHTTGRPDGLTDEKHLARILDFYQSADGFQPHGLIALDGTAYKFVDDDVVAYHAKIGDDEAKLYRQGYQTWSQWRFLDDKLVHLGGEWSGYRDWRDTWLASGVQSPLDLVTGEHPNGRSKGYELQQPADGDVTPQRFLRVQYDSLARALLQDSAAHGVPLDRQHVLGHSDVNPMTRSSARGGWDPGVDFSWNLLWDLIEQNR